MTPETETERARMAIRRIESQGRSVYVDKAGQIHVTPAMGLDTETIRMLQGARRAAVDLLYNRQHHHGLTYEQWRRSLPLAAYVNPTIAQAHGAYHVPDPPEVSR